MTPETPTTAPAPSAPAAPVTPSAPAAPSTLAEFRAQKAAGLQAPPEAPVAEPPIASDLPPRGPVELEPEPEPEPDEGPDAPAAQPQGPQPAAHRWKDPETGLTLDLRYRKDRRVKRALEDYARRLSTPQQPQPEPQYQPQARQAQPEQDDDPEPTLEQFADQPDPYAAHNVALARHAARAEFKRLQADHTRVERVNQVRAQIDKAQQAYDAELPQVRQRYADFDDAHSEVLETLGRLPMPQRAPIVHRLLTSPLRHDLTHYLGSHPDDLAAVCSARSQYEQGLVIGAIETRVRALVNQRAKPAQPVTPAPAPIAPVGGNASPVTLPDASKMTLAQFRANKNRLGVRA
jgi:hypothetical protein